MAILVVQEMLGRSAQPDPLELMANQANQVTQAHLEIPEQLVLKVNQVQTATLVNLEIPEQLGLAANQVLAAMVLEK